MSLDCVNLCQHAPSECYFGARTSDAAKLHPRAAAGVLPEGSSSASHRRQILGPLPFHASVGSAESVGSTDSAGGRKPLRSTHRLHGLTSLDSAHVFLPLDGFSDRIDR